jgi:hypothetical protein
MKVELIISKDRVPFIVEELGQERVTVSSYNEDSDRVKFEVTSVIDILYVFHAGVKCGQESMSDIILR